MFASRAECEDRLRAEFRIEMNAAVAESEQRWQNREQELQTQISELQSQLAELQSQVSVLLRLSYKTQPRSLVSVLHSGKVSLIIRLNFTSLRCGPSS